MKLETRNLQLLIPAVLLAAGSVFGFDATMRVEPPLISLGESAQITVEVRNAKHPPTPVLPSVDGLSFSGASQSTQMNWVNGKSDNFTAYTFQVYPQKTGDFTIGPFSYTVDGTSQMLQGQLRVVAGDTAQQAQSWSDLVFAKLAADRDSAYVQEPFELTLSIYSRQGVQLAGNINLTGMPETGLSELKWQEIPATRDVVNGNVYDVRRFHAVVRALSSGKFVFTPTVTAQVAVPGQRRQRSLFDSFFSQVETRPVQMKVEAAPIEIKPLPTANRPAGFTGAVGQFDFQVSAQPITVHPGDPITLTMTIAGDGNFDRIMPPALPDGSPFRLFGDSVRKQEDNLVRFEQVISPRDTEAKEIPSIPFSFFDTKSGTYRTVASTPIPITVIASSNSTAQVFVAKDSVVLPPPETPFATESDLQRIAAKVKSFWAAIRPWLWTVPAAAVLAVIIFAGRKIYTYRRKDAARVRRQKAPKAARKALKAAAQARRKNDPAAFYDALWNALADYFGNRLNLPPGDVTAAVTVQTLEKAGMNSDLIQSLREIFDRVEANRYGIPGEELTSTRMEELQQQVEKILKHANKISSNLFNTKV